MEAETSFIEKIVEMVQRRHNIEIDFSKFNPNDEKIIAASKQRSKMEQFEDNILYDPEHDYGYSYRKPSIMFQEACLLAYYRVEYIAVDLSYKALDSAFEILLPIVNENKIKLLPLSVNDSELYFEPVDNETIRFTLCEDTAFMHIVATRDNIDLETSPDYPDKDKAVKFVNLDDFVTRIKNTKSIFGSECTFKNLDSLILSGALDCFGHTRKAMFDGWQKFISGHNDTIVIEHNEEYTKRELGEFELTNLGWAYSSSCFFDNETGEILHIGSQE